MTRYVLLLLIYIPFYLLAMLLAPVLPLFRELRMGNIENNNGKAVGPRLPFWLSWFDTPDNDLNGDHGFRTKHFPQFADTYFGMVLWLWRNPANGFLWNVLSYDIGLNDAFSYTHSGNGLDVDKGKAKFGWYLIRCSSGAFHFRWAKQAGPFSVSFECGWLLDVYIKNPDALANHPKARMYFQPQIKSAKEA